MFFFCPHLPLLLHVRPASVLPPLSRRTPPHSSPPLIPVWRDGQGLDCNLPGTPRMSHAGVTMRGAEANSAMHARLCHETIARASSRMMMTRIQPGPRHRPSQSHRAGGAGRGDDAHLPPSLRRPRVSCDKGRRNLQSLGPSCPGRREQGCESRPREASLAMR